jgi:hypothetical protein
MNESRRERTQGNQAGGVPVPNTGLSRRTPIKTTVKSEFYLAVWLGAAAAGLLIALPAVIWYVGPPARKAAPAPETEVVQLQDAGQSISIPATEVNINGGLPKSDPAGDSGSLPVTTAERQDQAAAKAEILLPNDQSAQDGEPLSLKKTCTDSGQVTTLPGDQGALLVVSLTPEKKQTLLIPEALSGDNVNQFAIPGLAPGKPIFAVPLEYDPNPNKVVPETSDSPKYFVPGLGHGSPYLIIPQGAGYPNLAIPYSGGGYPNQFIPYGGGIPTTVLPYPGGFPTLIIPGPSQPKFLIPGTGTKTTFMIPGTGTGFQPKFLIPGTGTGFQPKFTIPNIGMGFQPKFSLPGLGFGFSNGSGFSKTFLPGGGGPKGGLTTFSNKSKPKTMKSS